MICDLRFTICDLTERQEGFSCAVNRQSKIENRKSLARGVILLEVVIAMSLFVIAAAVIGSAMNSASQSAADIHLRSQAGNLALAKLAELTCGAAPIADVAETPFDSDPDWSCQVVTQQIDQAQDLTKVAITVRNVASPKYSETITQWVVNPFAGGKNQPSAETQP
jgi:Tfp pilus assembly protein PilV